MSPPDALDARALVRRHGAVAVVDGADVRVPRGSLVALLGPSGSGKTSILRLVAGLDRGEGTVDIDGRRVSDARTHIPPEARGVGLVFQDSVLFPHLDVAGNVGYGLRGPDRAGAVGRMLELVGIRDLAARRPHELSGGEQQRVALARTLAPRPSLVLLDEPYAHLDASLRERVRDETLAVLRRTGTAALLVTHDQSEALAVADGLIVLRAGRVHQAGSPEEVYRHPADPFVASFVGRSTLVPVRAIGEGRVDSGFGPLEVHPPADPSVPSLAVLRPESVLIVADGEPGGVPGRVIRSAFRGADRLLAIELPDGTIVESAHPDPRVGDRVRVAVRGPIATVRAGEA